MLVAFVDQPSHSHHRHRHHSSHAFPPHRFLPESSPVTELDTSTATLGDTAPSVQKLEEKQEGEKEKEHKAETAPNIPCIVIGWIQEQQKSGDRRFKDWARVRILVGLNHCFSCLLLPRYALRVQDPTVLKAVPLKARKKGMTMTMLVHHHTHATRKTPTSTLPLHVSTLHPHAV